MLHLYWGDGKGKTTAAMGLSLRHLAINNKVLIITFLKDGTSSELKGLKQLGATIKYKKMPEMFIDLNDPKMIKEVSLLENELFDLIDDQYDCIILDELLDVIQLHLINEDKVYQVIKKLKDNHEIVMTGRMPTQKFKQLSDYSSQIKKHKHPYDQAIKARRGVEY